jgi:hypothetical protein
MGKLVMQLYDYISESGTYSIVHRVGCECALVISSRMCHHFKRQEKAFGQTDRVCANEAKCSSRLMVQIGVKGIRWG